MNGRTLTSIATHARRRLLLLVIAGLTMQTAAQESAPPQVGISPTRFELEIGARPTVESFRVMNFGDDPLEIQIAAAHWQMDERNQVEVIAPTEQSLDQWMVINPLRFTIPPGQTQAVRPKASRQRRAQPGVEGSLPGRGHDAECVCLARSTG